RERFRAHRAGRAADRARRDRPRRARAHRRGRDAPGVGAGPLSLSYRNRELAYLVAVGIITAVGFASVYIARKSEISGASLTYAVFFVALYLAAHVVARITVPYADPYLLPLAGLLTAIGLTEIYRLGPSNAFKQGLWVVIGVAVFAFALLVLRSDY